jgi:hypothetical protein
MSIQSTLLTTTPSNIYVSSGNTVVSTMYFCNTYTSAVYLNVYVVSAPNSIANVNTQIYSNIQLASGDTYVADWEKLVLGPGDQIAANVTQASVVNATVSYVGI